MKLDTSLICNEFGGRVTSTFVETPEVHNYFVAECQTLCCWQVSKVPLVGELCWRLSAECRSGILLLQERTSAQ